HRSAQQTAGVGGGVDPGHVQPVHHPAEAVDVEHIGGRDMHVGEAEHAVGHTAQAGEGGAVPLAHAGGGGVHHQGHCGRVACIVVELGQHDRVRPVRGISDPVLLPGEHVVVTAAASDGGDAA